MKEEDILILGGLGLIGYYFYKNRPAPAPAPTTTTTFAGYTSPGGYEGSWTTLVYGDAIEQQREALYAGDNLTSGLGSQLGITQAIVEENYAQLEAGGALDLVEAGDPLLAATIEESPWAFGA